MLVAMTWYFSRSRSPSSARVPVNERVLSMMSASLPLFSSRVWSMLRETRERF